MKAPKNFGKFSLSREMINDNPEMVQLVMNECIIVRAEMMFDSDCINYVAISPHFEDVPQGKGTPWYEWKVEDKVVTAFRPDNGRELNAPN